MEVTKVKVPSDDSQTVLKSLLSGGSAAAISKTIVAPIERIKLLLQVQHVSRTIAVEHRYKGVVDCLVRIPREQGFISYWRGNNINVIRAFPKEALIFASRDKYKNALKQYVFNGPGSHEFASRLSLNVLSGSAAGATSLSVLHPLDFARTRLAADTGRVASEREFKGLVHCITKVYKSDGLRGVYRGFLVSVAEIMFFRGCYFGFYDTLLPKDASLLVNYLVAQSVTTVSGFLAYPFDTVRRQMMMQSNVPENERIYKNTRSCWTHIYVNGGIKGFYKGVYANVLRGVGGALVLVIYDKLKDV